MKSHPEAGTRRRRRSSAAATSEAAAVAADAAARMAAAASAPLPRPQLPATTTALNHHTDDVSDDDEAPPISAAGNVPKSWYEETDHVGYSLAGRQVTKVAQRDGIDRFLASQDDPTFRWRVYDEETREEFVLSKRDVALIQRMRAGTVAHTGADMYPDALDIFTDEVDPHALNDPYEPKRRFVPSKWEMRRVYRIAKAIKEGRMARAPAKKPSLADVYLLWGEDGAALGHEARRKAPPPIPAPKLPAPGHAASYNPPPEYLLTEAEAATWEAADPADRPLDFLPKRYASLRAVPLYAPGLRERFERCLDLYLCPRMTRRRPDATPESLLPALPDPSELRPFPSALAHTFMVPPGHPSGKGGRVRSVSIDPSGMFLASGSDDGAVRLWDLATGKLLRTWNIGDQESSRRQGAGSALGPKSPVHCVAWCPARDIHVIAAVSGATLTFLYAGTCTPVTAPATLRALTGIAAAATSTTSGLTSQATAKSAGRRVVSADGGDASPRDDNGVADVDGDVAQQQRTTCAWSTEGDLSSPAALIQQRRSPATSNAPSSMICVRVTHPGLLRSVEWHSKGDYVATVAPQTSSGGPPPVFVHQLSRRASNCLFPRKAPGAVQHVRFHPTKPHLFVANQRTVRVYALGGPEGPELLSKLESGVKWISSMAVHPSGGDHVLLGSYDSRVVWFDAELASTPFRTLKYHTRAVRTVTFHTDASIPLMATAADDGSVHVFHARVFNDFVQNPLIVPVKILRAHDVTNDGLGCLDAVFHPTQPWLVTAGADGAIKLWRDLP